MPVTNLGACVVGATGSAGGWCSKYISVISGTSYPYFIGSAGPAGTTFITVPASNGSATIFGVSTSGSCFCYATGGNSNTS